MATDLTPPLQQTPALVSTRPIAPPLHTLGLIGAVLALSFTGADRMAANVARPHGRLILYIATIVVDWVIVGYIWMGLKRRGLGLRDVVGGKWKAADDVALDLAIAIGFWVTWSFFVVLASLALRRASLDPAQTMGRLNELKKTIGFIVPRGAAEIVAFIALTLTAGFCEELIYRGYFQQQFRAWTNNIWLAILAQGVLFGASHGYQGWRSMVVIAIFGCCFGLLAAWRKTLRPGMMAHAWQDLFTGFVLKVVLRLAP